MVYLITGASGFIGTALVNKLRSNNNTIICQSRSSHDEKEPNVKWICHDLINDKWENQLLPEIDVVIHLAGQTSVYEAKKDPIADLNSNVISFLKLLEYLKTQNKPPFVIFSGTATEVGITDKLPINENMPDNPITFYDVSKLSAELYLHQYINEGWVNGCTLRFSNVYGRSETGQHHDRGIIDKIFKRAILGQNITIYDDGHYVRDYIFIDDVISALILSSKYKKQVNGHKFYIGSGQGVTLKEAFLKVMSLAEDSSGIHVEYENVKAPEDLSDIEYRNVIIDSSAFKKITGWAPQYTLDEGLNTAYKMN